MAENTVKKIATRESYGNSLKELAEEFPNLVVLDADLAAATKTGIFRKAYPDRHIDCGCLLYTSVVQLTEAREHSSLPYLSFLDLTITQQCVYTEITFVHLSTQCHADGCGNALSQGSGGHILSLIHI